MPFAANTAVRYKTKYKRYRFYNAIKQVERRTGH